VTGVVALGASLALTLAACGGTDTSSQSGNGSTPAYNAGVDKIFNQSSATGGTLRMAHSGDWDSLDGADTYYAYSWDFFRLYGRTLTTFAAAPGEQTWPNPWACPVTTRRPGRTSCARVSSSRTAPR
jgi:peptide/nickel transport system substrate-binding protein